MAFEAADKPCAEAVPTDRRRFHRDWYKPKYFSRSRYGKKHRRRLQRPGRRRTKQQKRTRYERRPPRLSRHQRNFKYPSKEKAVKRTRKYYTTTLDDKKNTAFFNMEQESREFAELQRRVMCDIIFHVSSIYGNVLLHVNYSASCGLRV